MKKRLTAKQNLRSEIPEEMTAKEFQAFLKSGKFKEKKTSKTKKRKAPKKKLVYNDDPDRQREFEIIFKGKFYSVNKSLSNHFSKTHKEKKRIKLVYFALLQQAKIPAIRKIDLSVRFWSRHDTNGINLMLKWFEDSLTENGIIQDDIKSISRGQNVEPDESLERNTIVFRIKDIAN